MLSTVVRATVRRSSARVSLGRFYSEGATGATRPGGEKSSDSFNKREKAQEDFYVREHEKEKLAKLREALQKQREHLASLEKSLDDFEKK
ncbi:mitochondrial ATPase inhibitor, IATP-domain-containing protein [Dipodascopsis uninucleata]